MLTEEIISTPDREIVSTRILRFPREMVYAAMADPDHLKNWWGPAGFTNTFTAFDLRPGGKWSFIMHGPNQVDYPNECEFITIIKPELIYWKRHSWPLFRTAVQFEEISGDQTRIILRMIFDSPEECDKLKSFVPEKNEENFDRLEIELYKMTNE